MIREAVFKDLEQIYSLAHDVAVESSRVADVDEEVLMSSIVNTLSRPDMCAYVDDVDGDIQGYVAGVITPSLFSHGLEATDIFFASTNGRGAYLYKAFVKWAEQFNSVSQINFTDSFGNGKAGKLLSKLGFKQVGGFYVKGVER